MKLLERNIFHIIKLFCVLEYKYEIRLIFRIKQIMPIKISCKFSVKNTTYKDGHDCKDNIQMNAAKFSMLMNVTIDL